MHIGGDSDEGLWGDLKVTKEVELEEKVEEPPMAVLKRVDKGRITGWGVICREHGIITVNSKKSLALKLGELHLRTEH